VSHRRTFGPRQNRTQSAPPIWELAVRASLRLVSLPGLFFPASRILIKIIVTIRLFGRPREIGKTKLYDGLPPSQPSERVVRRQVRPIPGNAPHDRPVGRGNCFTLKEHLRRSLPHHSTLGSNPNNTEALQYAFSRQGGIYRSDVVQNQKQSQNQIPGRVPTASRWSAPSPGKRTRREDHALLIVRDEFRTGYSSIGVAVGTTIADRPPHRSVRAELPHTAPLSDTNVKTHVGIWM